MMGATAGMAALTVALTVLAGPLYGLASRAAGDLLDPAPYIRSVLVPGEAR
jgi:multicomponent Na+:H+ antiporter subunit D